MKKILTLILALTMAVGLCACGGSAEEPPSPPPIGMFLYTVISAPPTPNRSENASAALRALFFSGGILSLPMPRIVTDEVFPLRFFAVTRSYKSMLATKESSR